MLDGLSNINESHIDESLEELSETCYSISAGLTLEAISRIIQNDVLQPVFEFIEHRLSSQKWIDRYVSLLAIASIMEGPHPNAISGILMTPYMFIINMLDD